MARSFASGLVWGVVVVGAGLALVSQLAPLPKNAPLEAVNGPEATATGPKADDGKTDLAEVEGKAPADKANADKAPADAEGAAPAVAKDAAKAAPATGSGRAKTDADQVASTTSPSVAAAEKAPAVVPQAPAEKAAPSPVEPVKPAADQPKASEDAAPLAPDSEAATPQSPPAALPPPPDMPAVAEPAPALSSLDAALTAPDADEAAGAAVTSPPPAPETEGGRDALLVPSEGAGLAEPSRLPQIASSEDPGLATAPAPLPSVTPANTVDQAPEAPQALAPRVIKPDVVQLPGVKPLDSTMPTVLEPSVPGVETNALPQIGNSPAKVALTPDAAEKPIVKYARPFEGKAGKPLFVILLHDVGAAGMSRDDLAKLPFPVSFVVDPLATDAKEAAEAYRAAGQEVLMLANGIPPGATAGDLAQSFQTLQEALPEAVAVMDQETAGFQDNRALSTLVLPVIEDQGRGLVTWDHGLNAADQIARRDGLPATTVFRRLDGAGESQPVMRRYLDRAAFKAAQEGFVVVYGDTRADTVATILQWTIEGKASGVDLAPVTAVLARN